MIKNMYKDKVNQDVVQELVSKYYTEALDLHKLDPVGYPKIDFDALKEEEPFKFSAQFEIRPEVELKNIDGLKVQKEKLEISEDQVDKIVENLKNSYAEFVPVIEDRPAQEGDFAVIDFSGTCKGEKPESMQGQAQTIELGSGNTIEGFESGIMGMKPGQTKTLNLQFPKEYHAEEFAGEDVSFEITLKELKKRKLPELDDEFAKKVGFESREKMLETFQTDLKQSEERRIQEDFKNRVLKALVEANPVEVPQSLLDSQKQLIVEDVKQKMQQQGLNEEAFKDYVEKWNDDFEKTASHIVQSSFLINKIADENNLRATEEDFVQKLRDYAQQSGIELEKVRAYYSETDRAANLKFKITEDRVLDFLTDKVEIDEVPKSKLKDTD